MKVSTEAEIEVSDLLVVKDVWIGDKEYDLDVVQGGCGGDALQLRLKDVKSKASFWIHIDRRRLHLSRDVVRPNHDHWDYEDMRIVNGSPAWLNGSSSELLAHKLAWFEFGARIIEG